MKKTIPYYLFVRAFLIVSLIFQATTVLGQSKSKKKLPNIIYIYADDLGYGELGCYGQQKIKTPNLDRMAKEGMRFTNHYSSTPVCAPARCILLTGRHGGHSYIRGNYEMGGFADSLEGGQMPLPDGTFTIARMLKNAGYTTGMAGKWGLGMPGTTGDPLLQGFDYYYAVLDQKQAHNFYPTHLWENGKWDTLNNPVINVHRKLDSASATGKDFEYYKGKDYAVTKMTEKALAFIDRSLLERQAGKQNPFFLYLPYPLPHVSLQAPDAYVKKYIGLFNEKPYYGAKGYAASLYPLSTYAAMITYLDEQVGIIMQKIKQLGMDENTIIMFSSDNGPTFNGGVDAAFFNSAGGLRGLKMDLYEGGIREPFIARWPGKIPAGKTSGLVSAQFDMMATFADLTGQKVDYTDGISLLPELTGRSEAQTKRSYIYFEYPEKGGQVAIRMGNWKGVRTNVKKNRNAPWQVFNLKTDSAETTDVANDHPELVKTFNAIQKNEHQHAHIREWEFIDPKFGITSQ